jgi:DNA-binding NarL/FixJ family response regulator
VIAKSGGVDLTSREWEVLDLLCEDLSTAEIAERLSLSPITVRRHLSETTRKLGARDRVEAVALVEGRL